MENILGQAHAVKTLRAALDSARAPHAWIFHGPRGVGKFTTALEFAKVILDPEAARDLSGHLRSDPDGRIARLVDSENHPDLHIIRKELALYSSDPDVRKKKLTNIPIDVLRERMIGGMSGEKNHEPIAYHTASLDHGKVFIIDEAELLDQYGQNAILKTLEQPPPRTYIILVTALVDRLFPTVRSRCQRVAFTPLDEPSMQAWFARSGLEFDPEERAWVEQFADGSPGLARMAARDGLYQWWGEIAGPLREIEQGAFPVKLGATLAGRIDDFAKEWAKQHTNASKEMANRDGARRMFLLLGTHARNRLHRAIEAGSDPHPWLAVIDLVREAEQTLHANVNLKHVFENLVAQWADIIAEPARM